MPLYDWWYLFKYFIMWPNFIYWTHCYLLLNTWQAGLFFFFFLYWLFFMKVTKYLTSWNLYSREEKKINSKWIIKLCNLCNLCTMLKNEWRKEEVEWRWKLQFGIGWSRKVSLRRYHLSKIQTVEKNSHVFV